MSFNKHLNMYETNYILKQMAQMRKDADAALYNSYKVMVQSGYKGQSKGVFFDSFIDNSKMDLTRSDVLLDAEQIEVGVTWKDVSTYYNKISSDLEFNNAQGRVFDDKIMVTFESKTFNTNATNIGMFTIDAATGIYSPIQWITQETVATNSATFPKICEWGDGYVIAYVRENRGSIHYRFISSDFVVGAEITFLEEAGKVFYNPNVLVKDGKLHFLYEESAGSGRDVKMAILTLDATNVETARETIDVTDNYLSGYVAYQSTFKANKTGEILVAYTENSGLNANGQEILNVAYHNFANNVLQEKTYVRYSDTTQNFTPFVSADTDWITFNVTFSTKQFNANVFEPAWIIVKHGGFDVIRRITTNSKFGDIESQVKSMSNWEELFTFRNENGDIREMVARYIPSPEAERVIGWSDKPYVFLMDSSDVKHLLFQKKGTKELVYYRYTGAKNENGKNYIGEPSASSTYYSIEQTFDKPITRVALYTTGSHHESDAFRVSVFVGNDNESEDFREMERVSYEVIHPSYDRESFYLLENLEGTRLIIRFELNWSGSEGNGKVYLKEFGALISQ